MERELPPIEELGIEKSNRKHLMRVANDLEPEFGKVSLVTHIIANRLREKQQIAKPGEQDPKDLTRTLSADPSDLDNSLVTNDVEAGAKTSVDPSHEQRGHDCGSISADAPLSWRDVDIRFTSEHR